MPPEQPSGEIATARRLPWPREQVWGALAAPTALAEWWGPAGFTNEFHAFEFRPGGTWRFTMRAADGATYAMDHRFLEVVAPERLVIRHLQPGHDFTLTITLGVAGAGTLLGWSLLFDDPSEAARVRAFVAPANEQNLDRLAAHLAKQVPPPL